MGRGRLLHRHEIGWLAIGIGALVGFGVVLGGKEGSVQGGVLAVVISLAAIVGGKYASIQMLVSQQLGDGGSAAMFADDNLVISYLADEELQAQIDIGITPQFPPGADQDLPDGPEDYPAAVWAAAQRNWDAMSGSEQEDFRAAKNQDFEAGVAEFRSEVTNEAFKSSFGFMDLLFGALAIGAAFKIGSGAIES